MFGRYDSIQAERERRETQKQDRNRSRSPQSEGEPYVQKIDVPKIGPFAKQVLRKQVGPDEARLEELERIEIRYQDAVNELANARSPEAQERAREKLRRNPPLTVKQKEEKIRLEKRIEAVGRNPGIFPQIDKPLPVMGVGRRRRSKTKKRAVRRTRRGKVRVYS